MLQYFDKKEKKLEAGDTGAILLFIGRDISLGAPPRTPGRIRDF